MSAATVAVIAPPAPTAAALAAKSATSTIPGSPPLERLGELEHEIDRLAPSGRLLNATGRRHLPDDSWQQSRRVLPDGIIRFYAGSDAFSPPDPATDARIVQKERGWTGVSQTEERLQSYLTGVYPSRFFTPIPMATGPTDRRSMSCAKLVSVAGGMTGCSISTSRFPAASHRGD